MTDDERSVEDHLRELQRRPDDQQETRHVPLSEASAEDHFQAIRSRSSYGPGGTVITDDNTDRKDDDR